jgi:Coenzyme F420-dependent N5,N10-methylene tetrahydromethanopterin reductase and related flavin-dependent oxidoreductases
LKFGAITLQTAPYEELVRRWRTLESLTKIDTVWVADHLGNPYRPEQHWYEAWTLLGALATVTTRVRIGPLVSPITLRNPATLARSAVTLSEISGGRAELAVGAGGSSLDHELAEVENWEPRERAQRLEAFVERLDVLLHDDTLSPSAEVPLTIGGQGETALRLAARFATRWNTYGGRGLSAEEARRVSRERNARLDEFCAETGRTVVRSALIGHPFVEETPFRSDDAWEEFVAAWAEAGFDELILYYPAETAMPDGAVEPGLFERVLA